MGLQAAEQLVIELAASVVGTDFETTEDQKELNIPSFLVYLFGIVIAEDEYQRWKDHKPMQNNHGGTSYYFSPTREKRFFAFQKKYLAFAKNASVHSSVEQQRIQTSSPPLKSKPYKLTSRIFPSKDQQAIVKRDLLKECEKLESLSNEALEALLIEEPSSSHHASTKNKRKTRKNRKHENRLQPITETKDNVIVIKYGEEGKKTSILEEVVATTLQHPCVDRSMDIEGRGETLFVELKSTCDGEVQEELSLCSLVSDDNINAMTSDRHIGPVILKTEFGNSTKKDDGLTLIKNNIGNDPISSDITDNSNEEKYSSLANAASPIENIGSLINSLSSPPSLLPNNLPSLNTTNGDHDVSLYHSTIDASALTKQTERITDLEHDLAEVNRQLIGERLAHTKALRKEKGRYENLIRAMQLRLYISENKLRTYEDALEKHNQAVSAINSTSRSATTKNNNEERIPSSPSLISKVIENQSVRKSGDPMW
jgi:hypothetical protein